MTQNINHLISLYLTGKYPGYIITPDKLLFIDSIQSINPIAFSDEKIKLFEMFGQVNEYEFYLNCLNRIERNFHNQYYTTLDKLNIPKEIVNRDEHDVKQVINPKNKKYFFDGVKIK